MKSEVAALLLRRNRTPAWLRRLLLPRRKASQRVFRFVDRAQSLQRAFKISIALATIGVVAILLTTLASGRYGTRWLITRARWMTQSAFGLPIDRAEIDADLARKRVYDIEQSRGKLIETFAEYTPAAQRLLRFAGLDPDHALVRWGNFYRTVLLPATVFEVDNSGRSYRFRSKVRSIWIHNFPMRGPVKAYFQVPDAPGLAEAVAGTGAQVVNGSIQTTNSWGLRGPEPDLSTRWRGIVLGDSYMQGLFVGDDQTPTECLKRELKARLHAPVEILNTGHLGYSPEQYYFTLVEYARRFPPDFVVVSIFANDFGEIDEVLQGRGDFAEGAYWLANIQQFCRSRQLICLVVPAPWVNQLQGPQLAGNYPGMIANLLESPGPGYLDPIADFADAQLAASVKSQRMGIPPLGSPLFNAQLADGHFSPAGCELWASVVGRRLELLFDQRQAAEESWKRQPRAEATGEPPQPNDEEPTPRSP
jgi:hypothetical protein